MQIRFYAKTGFWILTLLLGVMTNNPFFHDQRGVMVYIYMYLLDVFLFRDEMSMVAQISGSLFCS